MGSEIGTVDIADIVLMHLKSIIYTGATNTTIKKMRYFNIPIESRN